MQNYLTDCFFTNKLIALLRFELSNNCQEESSGQIRYYSTKNRYLISNFPFLIVSFMRI